MILLSMFMGLFIHQEVRAQNSCKIDNLIVNGDFEDTIKQCYVFNPINRLSNMSNPWKGFAMFIWQPLTQVQPNYLDEVGFDHTTNTKNGHYLYIDPRNGNGFVWQFSQTVKVEKGKQYICSLWFSSMNKPNNPEAEIRLSVNGVPITAIKKINNVSNFWDSIQGAWNSGAATTAQISLELVNPTVNGKDFAVDDVYFGQGVLVADAGRDTIICGESDFKLGGNEPASLGASCNAYTYTWMPANAIDGPNNIAHPKLKKPLQNSHLVLKVSDMNGNVCMDTVTVSIKPSFHLNIKDSIICDSIKISVPDSIKGVLWHDGDTGHVRGLNGAGVYTIRYQGVCSIQYDTFVLMAYNQSKSVLKISNSFCSVDRFNVEIIQKKDPVKWWDEDTAHSKTFKIPGNYIFTTYTICGEKKDTVILKDSVYNTTFKVPNVFTPNKDGVNDCFELDGIGGLNCEKKNVLMYDRWGVVVFQGTYPETCWNGRLYNQGEELADGVYYYLIMDLNNPALEPISGIVHLIR